MSVEVKALAYKTVKIHDNKTISITYYEDCMTITIIGAIETDYKINTIYYNNLEQYIIKGELK